MISLKKGICALGFGIGLGVSLSAWALPPDCTGCGFWYQKCLRGDARYCAQYEAAECSFYYPECTG
jgi:hypothetical protein